MERIEVKRQEQQQRRSEHNQQESRAYDRDPIPLQEPVHRRQRPEPHRPRLGRRLQDRQQCRQQRDTGQKGDDHTGAGNLPEFG